MHSARLEPTYPEPSAQGIHCLLLRPARGPAAVCEGWVASLGTSEVGKRQKGRPAHRQPGPRSGSPSQVETCPTFENGGISAAPAAPALSLQAERTFQGQLHRPPPPHLQSPNSGEGGLREGCPLSWGWGCLSVADLRLRTQEQDRGLDPHASPSTSPNSLTAADMWLLRP